MSRSMSRWTDRAGGGVSVNGFDMVSPRARGECLRFDALPFPFARAGARSSGCQKDEMALAEGLQRGGRKCVRRAVTREAEGLGDLLSNSQKSGVGRVDRLPTGCRQSRHSRGEIKQAVPRPRRDATRQSRRCNACSRDDGSARRPMIRARLGRRGGKVQRPARQYRRAQPAQIRRTRGAGFALRRHKRRQWRATAARNAWTSRSF